MTPFDPVSPGRAFVARRGDEAVFVKLGAAHAAQGRLAALGVTPALIAQGSDFAIFRYVEGGVPDWVWMRDNAGFLVDLLIVVQRDEPLARLLAAGVPVPPLGEHPAAVVARLIERATRASAPLFRSSAIETSLEHLRTARHAVYGVPLVRRRTPIQARPTCSSLRSGGSWWTGTGSRSPIRCVTSA